MKRDMELVREVLLKLEALPLRPGAMTVISGHSEEMAIDGYSPDEVEYHLTQLRDAGFLDSPGSQPAGYGITFRSLSWEGHDFLDAVRSPEVWKRTKEGASTVGGWTFGLMKDMATAYAKHVAKEKLGLDL
jgi:DNA-binding transcriptional ArsR family regulator